LTFAEPGGTSFVRNDFWFGISVAWIVVLLLAAAIFIM
jgi:hypothetical protein